MNGGHGTISMLPSDRPRNRPRGIALLMSLAVVLLLTVFMSEYFFATGLELRGMTTYKEAEQARALARAVLKVVMIGLQMDEVEFFEGYRQAEELLQVASIPWQSGGLLVELKVAPQDHLYNLNEMSNLQPDSDQERGRRQLFFNILTGLEVPPENPEGEPEEITQQTIEELYTGLFDWIDADSAEFVDLPSARGAEADAYFSRDPEVEIKNAMLDRIGEIRLVRGMMESRVPWAEWENKFTALDRAVELNTHLVEKINVNVATHQEIIDFLSFRDIDIGNFTNESTYQTSQAAINKYIEKAENLADRFDPEEGARVIFSTSGLSNALKEEGFSDNYGINHLFSTVNRFYHVSLVTEVNEVQARLEALLDVPRDKTTRTGTSPTKVVWWVLR